MSSMPHSSTYIRFIESVKGIHSDHREELDVEALQSLKGDEKVTAEELLMESVKDTDDWRVPQAIVAINLTRAVSIMTDRLATCKGKMRLELARALKEFGVLERIDETVISMLNDGNEDEGIIALSAMDTLKFNEALIKALARASVHHPIPDVRINSGAQIIFMSGITDDPLVWDYRQLYLRLGEEDLHTRQATLAEICHIAKLPRAFSE